MPGQSPFSAALRRLSGPRRGKAFALALLLGGAALALALGAQRTLSFETVIASRAALQAFVSAHFALSLAAYVAAYVAAVALSVPGAVWLTIAGGALFGWFIGGLAAATGATLGATLVFLVARYALHDLVQSRLGARLSAISAGFRADAFSYLLFLRLVPAFPFFLVNLAPALAGVSTGTFVAATAVGILPATFAFASFGAGLDSAIAIQNTSYEQCLAAGHDDCRLRFDPEAALTPDLLGGLFALGLLALVPVGLRRWRGRRHTS